MTNWDTYEVSNLAEKILDVAGELRLPLTKVDAVEVAFDILARADIEISD